MLRSASSSASPWSQYLSQALAQQTGSMSESESQTVRRRRLASLGQRWSSNGRHFMEALRNLLGSKHPQSKLADKLSSNSCPSRWLRVSAWSQLCRSREVIGSCRRRRRRRSALRPTLRRRMSCQRRSGRHLSPPAMARALCQRSRRSRRLGAQSLSRHVVES